MSTKLDAGFGLTSDPPRRLGYDVSTVDSGWISELTHKLLVALRYRNNQRAHTNSNTNTHSSSAPSGSVSGSQTQGSTPNPKDAAPISCASSSFSMLLKSELLGISHRHDCTNYADCGRSYSSIGSGGAASSMATGNGCGIYNYSTSGGNPGAFGSSGTNLGFSGLSASSASSNILRFKAPRRSIHDEVKTPTSFSGIGCSSQRCVTMSFVVIDRVGHLHSVPTPPAATNERCAARRLHLAAD